MTARKRTTPKPKQQVSETQAPADATAPTSAPVPEAAPAVDGNKPASPVEPEAVPPTEKPDGMIKGYGAGLPEHAVIEAQAAAEIPGEEITGDGTGNALPPIEEAEIDAVMVRTKRRFKSRRRAGHRFNREGTGIALELLTKEQLKQLFNDPALDVMYCTIPVEGISEQES